MCEGMTEAYQDSPCLQSAISRIRCKPPGIENALEVTDILVLGPHGAFMASSLEKGGRRGCITNNSGFILQVPVSRLIFSKTPIHPPSPGGPLPRPWLHQLKTILWKKRTGSWTFLYILNVFGTQGSGVPPHTDMSLLLLAPSHLPVRISRYPSRCFRSWCSPSVIAAEATRPDWASTGLAWPGLASDATRDDASHGRRRPGRLLIHHHHDGVVVVVRFLAPGRGRKGEEPRHTTISSPARATPSVITGLDALHPSPASSPTA